MFISLDIETTGLDKRIDRIIEFGAVKFDLEGHNETFQTFINPGTKIPEFITYLTNITDENLQNAPSFEEAKSKITEFIGDSTIIGHFISFDLEFLKAKGLNLPNPHYDTAELARVFIPDLPSYSLEILSDTLDLKHQEKHRALDDSIAAQELFFKLIEEAKSLPENLFKEIQTLSSRSNWQFAEILKSLSANGKDKDSSKTTLLENPSLTDNSSSPLPPSSEDVKIMEILNKNKGTLLIESFNESENLPEIIAEKFAKKREKTLILVPRDIFDLTDESKKVGLKENYISLRRLEQFKQKSFFSTLEITGLIKILIWLKKTKNGLLTEKLSLNPDERAIFSSLRIGPKDPNGKDPNENNEKSTKEEPFLNQELEKEKNLKTLISEYKFPPSKDIKNLIIFDTIRFTENLQEQSGIFLNFRLAEEPILNLREGCESAASMNAPSTTNALPILDEFIHRLEFIFAILESFLTPQETDSKYPNQNYEVTNLDVSSSNWQRLREMTASLIESSQELKEIISDQTLPYLKDWKKVLKNLQDIFAPPDMENFDITIQKNRNEEIQIRKIAHSVSPAFTELTKNIENLYFIGKSIDANDDGKLIKTLLDLPEDTPIAKIEPPKEILKNSQILVAEDMKRDPRDNMDQTINFLKTFLLKEKGKTIIILNSISKLEQIHNILAPKLKREGINLLAQRSGAGTGKTMEMYKKSPETTSILLTPNKWESFNLRLLSKEEDFKNLIIHQLPFDPPSDIFLNALAKDFLDPWNELKIPNAILSLKKTVGKFLTKTPGKIIILDSRLTEKNYSFSFASALETFVKPETASAAEILNL